MKRKKRDPNKLYFCVLPSLKISGTRESYTFKVESIGGTVTFYRKYVHWIKRGNYIQLTLPIKHKFPVTYWCNGTKNNHSAAKALEVKAFLQKEYGKFPKQWKEIHRDWYRERGAWVSLAGPENQ